MVVFLHGLLLLISLPGLLGIFYLFFLTLLSQRLEQSQPTSTPNYRFEIIIPAHNEESVIKRLLTNLKQLDWPHSQLRITVIADNCNDKTAEIARASGAQVFERNNPTQRGKGYALSYGLSKCFQDDFAQAIVILDADSEVSPTLLHAFAYCLEHKAPAVQAHYGVLNPNDNWRTRLQTMAYGAFHGVRSRARERLNVSCGLRGNGMAFSRELLETHPLNVYSLAEDIEYGVQLGLAGIRVCYSEEAWVNAELPTAAKSAQSQRHRWEKGRYLVARQYLAPLLKKAFTQRSRVCLDLAFDLLTLPLAYLALNLFVVALIAGVLSPFYPSLLLWLAIVFGSYCLLAIHVFRGWQLSPLGPSALLELLRAPFFIGWKIIVLLRQRKTTDWVRTDREHRD